MTIHNTSDISTDTESPPILNDIQKGPLSPTHTRMFVESPYKRRRLLFILAVSCQLLILTGLASAKAYILATGTTVTLRTVPVDPRDIFRGDYVQLSYEISSLNTSKRFERGKQVYVVLRHDDKYWKAERIEDKPGQLSPSETAIKAKVEWDQIPYGSHKQHQVHLHYGIEQAFVPEGSGNQLQQQKHLSVDVAVDRFGNSVVKGVRSE